MDHSDKADKAALAELRNKLVTLNSKNNENEWIREVTDLQCLKFLRGHNLDVEKVFKLMQVCSKWRYDNQIDTIISRMDADESIEVRFAKAYLPMGVLGKDREGRAVCWNHMGVIDYPRLIQDFGLERLLDFSVYGTEKALTDNPLQENIVILNLGQENHPNPPLTSLFDVGGWVSSLLTYVKALSAIVDPFYPETTFKLIFINAPTMFWASWKIAKNLLAEKTREKVEVHSSPEASSKRFARAHAY